MDYTGLTTNPQWFASLYEYAMAHRCSTCKAKPGQECTVGNSTETRYPHVRRQDTGARHYDRDVAAAPLHPDRVPGVNYSTLG
jgi:hypothetical protein